MMISQKIILQAISVLVAIHHHCHCDAFVNRPPGRSRGIYNSNGGGINKPPHASNHPQPDWEDPEYLNAKRFVASHTTNVTDDLRGGSTNVVKGTKATISSTTSYWSNAFEKAGNAIQAPFRAIKDKVASLRETEEEKKEKELLEQLQTMKVQNVKMPKASVVPKDVVQLAARRSGLIGNPLRIDRVQEFASSLKRWYQMRGYVLHTVTGATLNTDTATAEIQVEEPRVALQPVDITFCKEMVVDEETGSLLTFRQYKERHSQRKTFGHKAITRADVNTTFVQTDGKTRAPRIAKALALEPGQPFQWDPTRWNMVSRSGIFGRVLQVGPKRMRDGSAQLHIIATESPPRHLEYGVSKSLYTGSWEGEVDFQHENLLGGGESLGLMVRRGTKDPVPSIRVRFSDDKFGLPHGYDVEAFSDFIGDPAAEQKTKEDGQQVAAESETQPSDPDKLLDRRGIKFTFRNPIDPKKVLYSTASTALERTATQSGIREAIGSGTLALGPFQRQLPLDARTSFGGSLTTGLRIPETPTKTENESGSSYRGLALLPYSSFTVTTTQILPLMASSEGGLKPLLALKHSFTGSTRNLPRHEQNAMGYASMIRGGQPKGRISTSVTGSTELRVPLQFDIGVPALKSIQQDASFVLFGDWVSARKNNGSEFFFEKSIGVGVRKVTQGIPLKLDFSYAGNGKIKSTFGLGRDFDV